MQLLAHLFLLPTAASAFMMSGFAMLDADVTYTPGSFDSSGAVVQYLQDRGEYSINDLPSNFNVMALPPSDGSDVGSVTLHITGPVANEQTENRYPYTVFSDSSSSGTINGRTLRLGEYRINAVPYTGSNGGGTAGDLYEISFFIVQSPGSADPAAACVPRAVDIAACTGDNILAAVQGENCDYFDDKVGVLQQACVEALQDIDAAHHFDLHSPYTSVLGDTYSMHWDSREFEEFMDGHTKLNYEIDYPDVALMENLANRIDTVYSDYAQSELIRWPGIKNFNQEALEWSDDVNAYNPTVAGCTLPAAMCCWVKDRQANDNNGNCADDDCDDADPADNTDICYTDASRQPASPHVAAGYGVFPGTNGEGETHCHGLAWVDDPTHPSYRFAGNVLFYVSMYDHLYSRGYTQNVPGAPMCSCLEQAATVSRSDCTEPAVTETFRVIFDGGNVEDIIRTNLDIEYNACDGATNNDLHSELEQLYDGQVPDGVDDILVGTSDNANSNCRQAQINKVSALLTDLQNSNDND